MASPPLPDKLPTEGWLLMPLLPLYLIYDTALLNVTLAGRLKTLTEKIRPELHGLLHDEHLMVPVRWFRYVISAKSFKFSRKG